MNRVILMGRLTRDPDVRYTQTANGSLAIARYTLAVDRRRRQQGDQPAADFISCRAFGKSAEFAEKYLHQGTKICVDGRIETGSYTNREGQKVYTTDVIVESQEFAESKGTAGASPRQAQGNEAQASVPQQSVPDEGFMNIPNGINDNELPFA